MKEKHKIRGIVATQPEWNEISKLADLAKVSIGEFLVKKALDLPLNPRDKRICPTCKNEFIIHPSSTRIYCSEKCYVNRKVARKCIICGTEFFGHKLNKYCSKICTISARSKKKANQI